METTTFASLTVSPLRAHDVQACARIAFEAHRQVSIRHGYPPEIASLEAATAMFEAKFADANARGFVAECAGEAVGSAFVNLFPGAPVAAIGPLTVHPEAPPGTGRRLLDRVVEEVRGRDLAGARLVQSPAHLHSLALYVKAGFVVREPLVLMEPGAARPPAGSRLRAATARDVDVCNELCSETHGFPREFELRAAIDRGIASVVEHDGFLGGYCTGIGFRGHAVARTIDDLVALITTAPRTPGPGFFVPIRDTELLRSLLSCGMRMLWPATLMTRGEYRPPARPYLPSIAF